ncbi:uncharacterized protein LOC123718053 isoform X2 [Pieris brassicae]|uniref:uncharacterized protein LOC123718053 isoform X2 n=1 Tax=Pieris brassicae TaxID=7116 RepID=UPI001E65F89C|nr:uncharacterized protein LOC123718053 isoform X2 [Pieris brassicae]
MSGPLGVGNYASFIIWFGVLCIYVSLLTITILGVVFILKRRSSILKSQRPIRTPFSELEFNVATPTDTTKSRRVSFSKRTGVAEFVTNEGTTTWKNFYEEHNKSLETSGNDASKCQRPQSIGQLGRHIFDQQFEEVEAIDFSGTFLPTQTLAQQLHNSLNVNITQQLAALECTGEKLAIPQQNFELSELTDQRSKLFNDDLTIPAMAEMSNQMNVDFSAMHSKCDDLDEIQKDLNRVHQNVVGSANFGNVSEYIEVDLNMTSVGLRNDDDMSITETVQSPKVQEVVKSVSKKSITKFSLEDKENIALNPYAPICESENFAVEEKSEVLVFDGKKLTVQIEKKSICAPISVQSQPRKTIILNIDDDLPNFISDPKPSLKLQDDNQENLDDVSRRRTTLFEDKSMAQALPGKVIEGRRQTVIYNNDCNMSTTEAIPVNIIDQNEAQTNPDRRRTIIYNDDCNMSTTQVISTKIYNQDQKVLQNNAERRRTIVYSNDCDISMTQALSSNVIIDACTAQAKEKRQTIVFENGGDLSLTQAIPATEVMHNKENLSEAKVEKRRTIIFENDGDISLTQAIPTMEVMHNKENLSEAKVEKRRTIIFENDGDLSLTQAIPTMEVMHNKENLSEAKVEKRRTIIFENDGDLSLTQAIPTMEVMHNKENLSEAKVEKRRTIIFENDGDLSLTQAIPTMEVMHNKENLSEAKVEKRRTIIFENDGDLSLTQAIPTMEVMHNKENLSEAKVEKRRTIIFENDADLSLTQAVPTIEGIHNKENLSETEVEKRRTIIFENDGDLSLTQAIPAIEVMHNKENLSEPKVEQRRTIIFENDQDLSLTQAIPAIEVMHNKENLPEPKVEKRRTIIFENDGDLSITQAIPTDIINNKVPVETKAEGRRTGVFDNDGDISITQALPTNIVNTLNTESLAKSDEKRNTIVYENDDISTQPAVSTQLLVTDNKHETTNKRRTIVHEDDGDISMTQAVSAKIYQGDNNIIKPVPSEIPSQIDINTQNKMLQYEDMDISVTQTLPQHILSKRRIICNEVDLSMTQAIPSNILNKNKTVLYDNNMDVSITQTIPQSVFIAQIEKQTTLSTNEATKNETQPAQILPRIESALLRECQSTMQNVNNLHGEAKREICVTQSESNITETKMVELTGMVLPENLVENMDTSDNIPSQHTDFNMSVDDVKIEEKQFQSEFSNTSIYETDKPDYGNLSLNKPIPSSILTLEQNLENKQRKSQHYHESLSGNQAFVYQSITNVKISDQEGNVRSKILTEKPSRESIKENLYFIQSENNLQQTELREPLDFAESIDRVKQIEEIKSDFEKPSQACVTGSISSQISTKTKKSILNELLDMSTGSEECFDDKNIKAVIESRSDDMKVVKDVQEDMNVAEIRSSDVFRITRSSFDEPELEEYRKRTEIEETPSIKLEDSDVDDLKNRLKTLKTVSKNRHYEQVVSEDIKEPDLNKTNTRKSFKNADDTRELLQMLSEFTDRPSLPPTIEEDMYLKEEEKYGETQTEPRRISFAANRRSVVLSKEELLNNISMAQAALQESRYLDETFDEATEMSNETIDIEDRNPKSLRISSDVVKELKFDDTEDDVVISPLKKTAFGETTYMNESKEKSKVIPTYDVTDGIKELMNDLVKPMADVLPFEAGNLDRSTKKSPSTISTQIQANLITSSQIDIDDELQSTPDSVADMSSSLLNKVASLGSKAIASVFPGPKLDDEIPEKAQSPRNRPSVPGHVLVFDPRNPLNNVILSTRDYENVHAYNPIRSTETLHSEREHSVQLAGSNEDNGRVETQYNVNVSIASGDAGSQINRSNTSIKSKPLSIDRSVEMKLNIRDNEINTEIAMKPNSELLEAHSSLTLVDDALARSTFDVDLDTRTESDAKSPVRVIYEMDENGCLSEKLGSEPTSNDEDVEVDHPKKRSLSPCVPKTDLTPKPHSKIQKMSNSPLQRPRTSPKKPITVQEIMTQFNITKSEQNAIVKQVNKAVDFEMRSVTSYDSSQSAKSEREFSSDSSRVDFRCISEQSSKNMFDQCESSTNVVAKIDMLPFMGSRDCEWESTSGDTWTFLLLRSRVRVTVKREHSYFNASRTSVRADTPVMAVNVDMVHNDEKDELIALCLRLATQSMRYQCSRECTTAGQVPTMLKRCVSVSKTAVQWLKAMRDAMLRLAFQVDRDGCLTLKVANVRLRSVWEVSMRIELTVEDAHESAWPCANSIGISTIVADVDVAADSLNGLIKNVPHDWGHVPRTIWKLFKYLKNKPRDDDFYGINILNMVK